MAEDRAIAAKTEKSAAEEIGQLLDSQRQAWNKGDLEMFMNGYLNSPQCTYSSGNSQISGFEALSRRYADKYGKNTESMGQLKFSDLQTRLLGKEHALTLGRFHLELNSQVIDGIFSLVLEHGKEGWKIIHDHSSVGEKP